MLQSSFAAVAKSLASPHRLAILDILGQGERSVEDLVVELGQPFANVSQHLQVLRRAGLVSSRREGQRVVYRLAGDDVVRLCDALKATAGRHMAEAERALSEVLQGREELESLTAAALRERIEAGEVTVIDVRSRRDYDAGHIPGALSIPHDEVERRLGEVPREKTVVAYCRGPYCVCADEAVRALLRSGFRAVRLDVGLPQWRAEGLRVEPAANRSDLAPTHEAPGHWTE